MPDGLYLSAPNYTLKELTKEISDIKHSLQKIFNFLKWHIRYIFRNTGEVF